MFKGFQKLMVLKELIKNDLSGYSLIKRLEEITGKKPSPGYIYPLLKELTTHKYIIKKVDGRKNIYSIVQKGKKLLGELQKDNDELQSFTTKLASMRNNMGSAQKRTMSFISKNFDAHSGKILMDTPLFLKFMKARMLVFKSDFKIKKKQYRKIITDATKKLNELAKK